MGRRILWFVGAHDAVAATQQRHAGGDAGLEPLESGKRCLGPPEFGIGRHRIDDRAGIVPGRAIAAAHRLDQAMAGMRMDVDQSRHDRHSLSVDHLAGGVCVGDLAGGTNRRDAIALHRHGAVVDDPALVVHGHHEGVVDANVGHGLLPILLLPASSAGGAGAR